MNEEQVNIELDKLKQADSYQKFDRIAKFSNLTGVLILILLFILFVYGTIRYNKLGKEIQLLEEKKQNELNKLDSLATEYKALDLKKKDLQKELMNKKGLPSDSIQSASANGLLEKSISADDAIKSIVSNYKPSSNVSIAYYAKTVDEKEVAIELETLGYHFAPKQATVNMGQKATNAIWFGVDVPIDDLKIVALALLRAGVPIKGIRSFKSNARSSNYKRNIIEVGASVDLEALPILTVDQVKNASQFER
jgi:hypothetical protein